MSRTPTDELVAAVRVAVDMVGPATQEYLHTVLKRYDERIENPTPEPATQPGVALVAEPGDTLIIGFAQYGTVEETQRLRTQLEAALPAVRTLVISGVSAMAVVKAAEMGA